MCERQRNGELWTESALRERLRLFHTTEYSWSNLSGSRLNDFTKAAVLVPLVVCDGQVEIWLTERSQQVRNDRGDVAFPGGKKDDDDVDAVETSLREAEEEIGLKKHQVEVVAEFLPRFNIRRNLITFIAGIVDPAFRPTPNIEVSRAFRLPLDRFLSNDSHWSFKSKFGGDNVWTHFFEDHPAVVYGETSDKVLKTWGLTASSCIEVACAVFNQPTAFNYYDERPIDPSDPFYFRRRSLQSLIKSLNSKL